MTIKAFPARSVFTKPDGKLSDDAIRWLERVFVPSVNANTDAAGGLAAAVTALIVGEMVLQPSQASLTFPDVMQTASCPDLGEMTFQQ